MLYHAFIAITLLFSLFAVELKDLQRTEDWEVRLGEADRLTQEQQFDAAHEAYLQLAEAADHFSFPLMLKAKCRNNHGAMLHLNGKYAEAEAKCIGKWGDTRKRKRPIELRLSFVRRLSKRINSALLAL